LHKKLKQADQASFIQHLKCLPKIDTILIDSNHAELSLNPVSSRF